MMIRYSGRYIYPGDADCTESKLRRQLRNIGRKQMEEERNKVENMERRWWIEERVWGWGGREGGGVAFYSASWLNLNLFSRRPPFSSDIFGFVHHAHFAFISGKQVKMLVFQLEFFVKQQNVRKKWESAPNSNLWIFTGGTHWQAHCLGALYFQCNCTCTLDVFDFDFCFCRGALLIW